jgi:hypothetical protein
VKYLEDSEKGFNKEEILNNETTLDETRVALVDCNSSYQKLSLSTPKMASGSSRSFLR